MAIQMGTDQQPSREPQIMQEVNRLESELKNFDSQFQTLMQRLMPVLRTVPEKPSGASLVEKESTAPLAQRINTSMRGIAAINIMLNDLLQRLEV